MEYVYRATDDFEFRPALLTNNTITKEFKRKGAILSTNSSTERMGNSKTVFVGSNVGGRMIYTISNYLNPRGSLCPRVILNFTILPSLHSTNVNNLSESIANLNNNLQWQTTAIESISNLHSKEREKKNCFGEFTTTKRKGFSRPHQPTEHNLLPLHQNVWSSSTKTSVQDVIYSPKHSEKRIQMISRYLPWSCHYSLPMLIMLWQTWHPQQLLSLQSN